MARQHQQISCTDQTDSLVLCIHLYIDVDVNEINFSLQNLVSCQDNYEKTRFVPGKN